MNKEAKKYILKYNRILLGWFAVVFGLILWFSPSGPSGLAAYFSSYGLPLALLLAWIIILAEIFCGIAILKNWKLKYTAIPPAVILIASALANRLLVMIFYLLIAADYLAVSIFSKK